jgi:hypothetical protein
MKSRRICVVTLLLAACGQSQPNQDANYSLLIPKEANPQAPPPPSPHPPAPSLPETSGPIDPKSVEAAGQVVQRYGALIEQGRLAEAQKLWGDATAAAAFAKSLKPNTHLEIGELGQTEGAAGSIYTTVPVVFYGDGFREPASVILRRVNDVPGSTEEQRRWHMERIDWKAKDR